MRASANKEARSSDVTLPPHTPQELETILDHLRLVLLPTSGVAKTEGASKELYDQPGVRIFCLPTLGLLLARGAQQKRRNQTP